MNVVGFPNVVGSKVCNHTDVVGFRSIQTHTHTHKHIHTHTHTHTQNEFKSTYTGTKMNK